MKVNIMIFYWKYIVFKYNQNNIDEAKSLAEHNGIKFKLVKSSRYDESYRYGEWKDEMWDRLLFKPDDEYVGNSIINDNKQ